MASQGFQVNQGCHSAQPTALEFHCPVSHAAPIIAFNAFCIVAALPLHFPLQFASIQSISQQDQTYGAHLPSKKNNPHVRHKQPEEIHLQAKSLWVCV